MSYLLDSNIFIQAKNLHYGFDFCPAFWDWLAASNAVGKVFSVEKVGDELIAGSDELAVGTSCCPVLFGSRGIRQDNRRDRINRKGRGNTFRFLPLIPSSHVHPENPVILSSSASQEESDRITGYAGSTG
ncbi:MAG: DUF4411 family protein [Spirochaetota bacterium]